MTRPSPIRLWLTVLALAIPVAAEAGVVTSAASKAASQAAAKAAANRAAIVSGKPRDVIIQRSRHPEAATHIEHAQRKGQPTVLTLDKANQDKNRAASMKGISRKDSSPAGKDRDEYPPAITREGGSNASVRYIDAKDNRGAGSSFRHQVDGLEDGAKIRVLVTE